MFGETKKIGNKLGKTCSKGVDCLAFIGKKNVEKKSDTLISDILKLHNIKDRRYVLREMVLNAVSQAELTEDIVALIYKVANAVEVGQEKTDDMFIWAAQGMQWHIDGNKLIDEDL